MLLYSVQNKCWNLSADTDDVRVPALECLHTEADIITFYIYSKLRLKGSTAPVIIDAEDTDIIVLSAYVSHHVDGTLGIKRNKQHMTAPKFVPRILFLSLLLCTSSQDQMQLQHFLVMERGLYMTT